MKFLDVKTDYAFKKVFGSEDSVPVLKSFLNAILGYNGEQEIIDLAILDPYMAPKLEGMKDTFVDVKAKLANGKHVIIEMQVLNVDGFESRILFNAAKQYSQQLVKGEKYAQLCPVIALTFTDFDMFKGSADAISQFKLMETTRYMTYSDDVELIFVELPKFTKTLDDLDDIKDKWIYFVKHARSLNSIPDRLNEPCIKKAFEVVNEAGLSREELEQQAKRHDFIWMQQGSIYRALRVGREEGHKEGREEGREEALFDSALMMVNDFKVSPREVAKKLKIPLKILQQKLAEH